MNIPVDAEIVETGVVEARGKWYAVIRFRSGDQRDTDDATRGFDTEQEAHDWITHKLEAASE